MNRPSLTIGAALLTFSRLVLKDPIESVARACYDIDY